jgi:hypothetical protein
MNTYNLGEMREMLVRRQMIIDNGLMARKRKKGGEGRAENKLPYNQTRQGSGRTLDQGQSSVREKSKRDCPGGFAPGSPPFNLGMAIAFLFYDTPPFT